MKLNNKGFAISTIMYMILMMAVVLITLTLSLLSSRKIILDKTKQEAIDNIYNVSELSYRKVLEVLKGEAIVYAQNESIKNGSVLINDLNSSIDIELLNKYNLYNKNLIITYENDIYEVSLES